MTIILDGTNGITTPTETLTGSTSPTNGTYLPTTNSLGFSTNSTERLRIDSSGNVGIGTTSPSTKLHVAGTVLIADGVGCTLYGNSTSGNYSKIEMFNPTNGNMTLTTTYSAGNIVFATNSSERMRIDSNGTLFLGQTSNPATGSMVVKVPTSTGNGINFQASGSALSYGVSFYNNTGGLCGYVSFSGTTASYVTSSDYRLKENVEPMKDALSKVQALKPCTYTWKSDGSFGQGFIAHELQKIVPDCVVGEKDDVNADGSIKPQGIDTSFLVATLTAAIQELNAKVESLEAQLKG